MPPLSGSRYRDLPNLKRASRVAEDHIYETTTLLLKRYSSLELKTLKQTYYTARQIIYQMPRLPECEKGLRQAFLEAAKALGCSPT